MVPSETSTGATDTARDAGTTVAGTGPVVLQGLSGLQERVGTDFGVSGWHTVQQEDITTFARLTGDEQWIHVDPELARGGPFGRTVQHGFLTLGLATGLLWEVCMVEGFGMVINYGLNKVRFPAPLPVDSRVRMHVELLEVNVIGAAGDAAEAVYRLVYEVENAAKPCCVADLVFRYYP
jgi:acyl dehydratase